MWQYWCPCVKTHSTISPTPIFIPTTKKRHSHARRISPLFKAPLEHGPIDNRNAEQTEKRKQKMRSIIISSDIDSVYYRNIKEQHEKEILRIRSIIDCM